MKYVFKVEIETNDNFDEIVNKNLEWNKKYNPNRTFEDEALSCLYTSIEDSIINDCADDIDKVNVSIIKSIDEEKLNELAKIESPYDEEDFAERNQYYHPAFVEGFKAGYRKAKEE